MPGILSFEFVFDLRIDRIPEPAQIGRFLDRAIAGGQDIVDPFGPSLTERKFSPGTDEISDPG